MFVESAVLYAIAECGTMPVPLPAHCRVPGAVPGSGLEFAFCAFVWSRTVLAIILDGASYGHTCMTGPGIVSEHAVIQGSLYLAVGSIIYF